MHCLIIKDKPWMVASGLSHLKEIDCLAMWTMEEI